MDSYRAHGHMRTSAGPVAVAVWMRRMQMVGGSLAVAIVAPETEPKVARSVEAFFGPEAVDLAVGTVDSHWRIDRVTSSEVVLGLSQCELAGVDLTSLVHPGDVDRLLSSVRKTADSPGGAFVRVRLRHAIRGWPETRCLFFPLPEDEHSSMAFVLAQTAGAAPPGSDAERIATLERHLLRFAAELHAAGWRVAQPGIDVSRLAALDELPRRQRDIVDRLLRGERIVSIADSMYITASTVRNHLSQVYAAFGVHSQSELLALLRSDPDAVQRGERKDRR